MRRRRSACVRTCLLLVALLVAPAHSTAGELSRDELRWAKTCIKNLGANSSKVRAGAEQALIKLGSDVLETLFSELNGIKGRAAEAGLGRVLAGLGRERVTKWIARKREALGGAPNKKLERMLTLVGGTMTPGESLDVEVVPSESHDWRRVPFGAEHRITDMLPRGIAGAQFSVATDAGALKLDLNGDGTFDLTLAKGTAKRVEVGLGRRSRPLLVYDKLGTWYACSASVRVGMAGNVEIAVWDADMDGTFGGQRDYIRVGSGAWIRQTGWRRVSLPAGPTTYEVTKLGEEVTVSLTPVEKPGYLDSTRWRALRDLNDFRSAAGLAALVPDEERNKACNAHARYLGINAAKHPDVTKGGNTHGQSADREGYSEAGDTAGRSSNISPGGLDDAVPMIAKTMLHRINFLGPSKEGVGLGHARIGKQEWTVIWCGDGDASEYGAVIAVPAPGQDDVLRRGGGEWPPPDAPVGFYKRKRGFPVSVTYAPFALRDVKLALFHEDGESAVAGYLWTTEHPVAKTHATNNGSAFFMPSRPLARKTTYWAVFSARRNGTPIRRVWTFKTR